MDDTAELAWRRQAIRLMLKGLRPCTILKQIPRSHGWLYKWQARFAEAGWPSLKSRSRQPRQSPQKYGRQAHNIVIRVRRAVEKRGVGLVGARAIQQEMRQQRLLREMPALATIKRWLCQAGLVRTVPPAPPALATVYYPQPRGIPTYGLHAMDWTARYLSGGTKIFVFHTVQTQTRALVQTISPDKTGGSLHHHVLRVWQTLGVPDGLQLDNDAAFTGGEKTPRRFGSFVRLCLYLGIEPIFIPPGEPQRNGLVEGVNALWVHSFWQRQHFVSLDQVLRKSSQFTNWYAHTYCPPGLGGLTPAQAQWHHPRRRLTARQVHALPQSLPITAGRIHFIRRVSGEGEIRLLAETWKVSKRLAHQYVWATVTTHTHTLEIHHRRSTRASARLVKSFRYELPEPVQALGPDFQRDRPRRKITTML
jgi:hypothetical protein